MTVTLEELLKVSTPEEILDTLIVFLKMGGFPTANWESMALPRHLTEAEAKYLADLEAAREDIVRSGFNRLARGAWLDLTAQEFFQNTRKGALRTQGKLVLTDTTGAGPYTKQIGEVFSSISDGSKRYKNLEAFTVPQSGSTPPVLFEAEFAGAAFNVGNNAITKLVTSMPGVAVTNPDPGTGTWVTQQGTDAELDEALQQRNEDRWSTLGSGANEAAYRFHAVSASAEVTDVTVLEGFSDGHVEVYLRGASGGVSTTVVSTVDAVLQVKARPLGVRVFTYSATNHLFVVGGTILVNSDQKTAERLVAAQSAIEKLFRTLKIGGKVIRAQIIEDVMALAGVYNFLLNLPASDTQLGATQVAVPDFSQLTCAFT